MPGVRFVLRALAILGFFAFHGLRFFVGWLGLCVTLAGSQRRKKWFAACVLALFRDLGATFIKVGQIMSTRPDLLPPHIIAALEKLQDEVGAFPLSQVQATILAELGRPF